MEKPGIPLDEDERLKSLRALALLDTPIEERFERITRTAARMFGVPLALVSLVDGDRQWFKSAHGTDLVETSRDTSFCGHAILGDDAFVVSDAKTDRRFADNPMVMRGPKVRFYAGHPVRSPDGRKVGTLCLMDRVSRDFSTEDQNALRDLAAWVERELQATDLSDAQKGLLRDLEGAERKASIDSLTRLWNHQTILAVARRSLADAVRANGRVGAIFGDVDHFKALNDTHGHLVGDAVLREVGNRIQRVLRVSDSVGRWGGEEFLVVLHGASAASVRGAAGRICSAVGETPFMIDEKVLAVTISLGAVVSRAGDDPGTEELIRIADEAMYRAKELGRNRVEFVEPGET